ncbi:MAG: hypothetical protein J3K34DRAFT_97700 [Monoraphidium minutum]|nr:MAG: hypothetical protein J3K34DRAFT_97700 [Monoraphidium minutum]
MFTHVARGPARARLRRRLWLAGRRNVRLLAALPHLPPLALEAPHPLLTPLWCGEGAAEAGGSDQKRKGHEIERRRGGTGGRTVERWPWGWQLQEVGWWGGCAAVRPHHALRLCALARSAARPGRRAPRAAAPRTSTPAPPRPSPVIVCPSLLAFWPRPLRPYAGRPGASGAAWFGVRTFGRMVAPLYKLDLDLIERGRPQGGQASKTQTWCRWQRGGLPAKAGAFLPAASVALMCTGRQADCWGPSPYHRPAATPR